MKKIIDIIAGARPNFMKISSIIHAIELLNASFEYRLVHTGQHYDQKMSESFFNQLKIPKPKVNLQVGSGSHARQTAKIMIGYEKLLLERKCDICLVVGDVNSTMACALVAKKMSIRVAHVEAGIRSYDLAMPEEINRIVTDSITDYFFTTSNNANSNLLKSGIKSNQIFFVGNTMIDTLLRNIKNFKKPNFWFQYSLCKKEYFVLTMHRPDNVDNFSKLNDTLKTIGMASRGLPVIFPVHPRTKLIIEKIKDIPSNIIVIDPQPYHEFGYLIQNAKGVLTDSGGITEETTALKIPCITLRESTERPETVEVGTNILIGLDSKKIKKSIELIFTGKWKKGAVPAKWDGNAGKRIVKILEKII